MNTRIRDANKDSRLKDKEQGQKLSVQGQRPQVQGQGTRTKDLSSRTEIKDFRQPAFVMQQTQIILGDRCVRILCTNAVLFLCCTGRHNIITNLRQCIAKTLYTCWSSWWWSPLKKPSCCRHKSRRC